jgi:hypothetical protein
VTRFHKILGLLEEHFDRLRLLVKSFDEWLGEQFKFFDKRFHDRMAISEPWLPEEHFLHSEPEYYLAAFLYSFLPNRTPSMGLPTSIEFLMQSATLRRSGPTVVRKANDSGQRQQGIIRCKIVQRTRRRNAISAGTFVDDFSISQPKGNSCKSASDLSFSGRFLALLYHDKGVIDSIPT